MAPEGRPSRERVDEALRGIGLVAVEAAALELNLARLAWSADDAIELETALRLSNKKKVEAIKAGLQFRRNPAGSEKRDLAGRRRAIAWAEGALELLRQRGDLMYSEWIMARRISDLRAPKEWLAHHLSSGRRTPVDPEALGVLADQIASHRARFSNIWQFAMRAVEVPRGSQLERMLMGQPDDRPPSPS
jgi:hypothetical protein